MFGRRESVFLFFVFIIVIIEMLFRDIDVDFEIIIRVSLVFGSDR